MQRLFTEDGKPVYFYAIFDGNTNFIMGCLDEITEEQITEEIDEGLKIYGELLESNGEDYVINEEEMQNIHPIGRLEKKFNMFQLECDIGFDLTDNDSGDCCGGNCGCE